MIPEPGAAGALPVIPQPFDAVVKPFSVQHKGVKPSQVQPTRPGRALRSHPLLGLLGQAAVLGLLGGSALAQPTNQDPAFKLIRGGGTPAVFGGGNPVLPASSCPAIVNVAAGEIQPIRIAPADVNAKNRLGCLSPNDAVYGADGCPLRLCAVSSGAVPLPAAGGASPNQPQLPEP